MKTKRLLSLLISLMLIVGCVPIGIFANAGGSAATAEVTILTQWENAFLCAPTKVSVSSELSNIYGYTDKVTDGVSALDVLIRAHELVLTAEVFTPDTASEILKVGDSGFVSAMFGDVSGNYGFMLNKGYPNDGTSGEYGYNGKAVVDQTVVDDDIVDFFMYSDSLGKDLYTWLGGDLSAAPGGTAIVKVSGISYGWESYKYGTPETLKAASTPLKGVKLGWVDENGTVAEISGVTTDENGNATITIPGNQAVGTYSLTACGSATATAGTIPVLMNPTSFVVSSNTTPPAPSTVAVSGVSVEDSLSLIVDGTGKLTAEVAPANATNKNVLWSSDNEGVATVDDEGKVTAVSVGTANISVSTVDGNFTAQCVVTVSAKPSAEDVLHNIAAKYVESGIANDGNAPWLAADLVDYAKVYPNKDKLSEDKVQKYLDELIAATDTEIKKEDSKCKPNNMAKYIIAFRALGYDPTQIVTSDFRTINAPARLAELINSNNDKVSGNVKNYYTLPYVMIAMAQDSTYLDSASRDKLIGWAKSQKESWQNTQWGVDGMVSVMAALVPYKTIDTEIAEILEESLEIIKGAQATDGSVGNAASTGLTIAAVSAMGIDAENVKNGDKSLIDGLMNQVAENYDGFKPTNNSFSTEQGMRGLVAWQLFKRGKGSFYDFSASPKEIAHASWGEHCSVMFEVIPDGAEVVVEGQTAETDGMYDLPAGEYSYMVRKSGYVDHSGTFTVSQAEDESHAMKKIRVSLAGRPSSENKNISVKIKVITHGKNVCNGTYTYKHNVSDYSTLASATLTMKSGQTVFDALLALLTDKKISYVEKTTGYISEIGDDAEFDHGANSGWMFDVNGKVAKVGCRNVLLTRDSSVVWFYTDDYTTEYGSESWSGSSSKKDNTAKNNKSDETVKDEEEKENKNEENNEETLPSETETKFAAMGDIAKSEWYYDAVRFVFGKGIMNGVSGTKFAPNDTLTRGMLVTVLYRNAGSPKNGKHSFSDVKEGEWYEDAAAWAAENSVTYGVSDTEFAPDNDITREELVVMIYRYVKMTDKAATADGEKVLGFGDGESVADYAREAFAYAITNGLVSGTPEGLLKPQDKATRAETAVILMRLLQAKC